MQKDFQRWHNKKAVIDEKETRVFFHEREIWFGRLGTNVGFEQDGKGENFGRPIIVFRKFNREVFWAVPLTTGSKGGTHGHSFAIATSRRKAFVSKDWGH